MSRAHPNAYVSFKPPYSSMPSSEPAYMEQVAPTLVPELRRYIDIHRQRITQQIESGGDEGGVSASKQNAKAFDGLVSSLYYAVMGVLRSQRLWRPVSLAAVGSFGRGALPLYSDLDVRLLCHESKRGAERIAEALLYPLWDCGLSVGHQVVMEDELIELARTDLPTLTSLLDWRHLAGDQGCADRLVRRVFEESIQGENLSRFLEQLGAQAIEREERYGNSVYLLEPDVKNAAGGLRDLDVANWAARARWQTRDLQELLGLGVLTEPELGSLSTASEFIWRVRNALHWLARRRSDRLGFEQQETLADKFGYGKGGPAVEGFMSDYYRHARTIQRGRDMILSRALPTPARKGRSRLLGHGLRLTSEGLSLKDPAQLEADPALAFRLYWEAVKRDLPVYDVAREQIARVVSSEAFCEKLRAAPEASSLFLRLLKTVKRTQLKKQSVLRELHDVGLLLAMIPEFAPVVGRAHNDIYHVYTVDVHSVAAVDKLAQVLRGDLAQEYPLASRVALEVARKRVLFLATLLHDVGKDLGGKNHSERGAQLAKVILARLGVPAEESVEVQHLISKHLRMYHVATRRDVDDPKTLTEFCADIRGREGLKELYLLTLVDVSTTSPTAMTSWKARMLEELYSAALHFLMDGADARDRKAASRIQQTVLKQVPKERSAWARRLLGALPERYCFVNRPSWVVRHLDFIWEAEHSLAKVGVLSDDDPYIEVCVAADDRPGLLSLIAASFSANHLKVIGAQIYSYRDQGGRLRILDMFWVRGGTSSETGRKAVPRVERDLLRLLSGQSSAEELLKRLKSSGVERPQPEVSTRVVVDNQAASEHTVVEVLTRDRPALLYHLARAINLNGFTIDLAKINTEGVRVADVFYVKDEGGTKVTESERIEELKAQILSALSDLERDSLKT